MRILKLAALEGTAFCAFACALWLGAPSRAEAGPLCPAYVVQYGVGGFSTTGKLVFTGFGANPVNGACTNFGAAGAQDPAAFSGAALASQALSELSQSTSQETARSAENSIANRRDQEEQRCAEGFSRVNGACERNAAAAAEEPPPPAAEPAPAPEPVHKKGKKAKAAKKAKEAPAPREVAKPVAPVTYAARRPMVVKGYEPPPPIEPPFRYGVWGQVFGDYEKRDASSATSVSSPDFATVGSDGPNFAGVPVPLDISVQSRTGTVGFQAGIDLTSRGMILSNDGLIAGFLVGYIHSNVIVNTTSTSALPAVVSNGSTHLTANLSGPTLGTYATYFTGPFSADFLAKFDLLSLDQDFDETFGFGGPAGPFNFGFSGSGSTSLVNSTIAANLNYRLNLYPNFWVEPTVGAQFTALSYGGGAAQLGLEDGQQVMVQGGARFGTSSLLSNGALLTSTLTGLAYDDVVVHGGFIPGAAFQGNNILADADRGKVRGKGILAFALDFGHGVTSFVQGDVYGGQGLIGAGGKAGIRYQW